LSRKRKYGLFLYMINNLHPLLQLIAQGEHQQQDFKFEVNDPKKLAITLSAFANTDGGRLLIGVKDNGTVRGVNPEEEFHVMQSAAGRYCDPPVAVISQIWKIKDRQVLEVEVKKAEYRPVKALDEKRKGWAYVRVGDRNILAHPVMLELWKQERSSREFWMQYKDGSEMLLKLLADNTPVSSDEISLRTGLSKRIITLQLAYLVRWGLARFVPQHDSFLFQSVKI